MIVPPVPPAAGNQPSSFMSHEKLWRWGMAALVLLAFGLRLHNADLFSFWTDEGLTPLRASYSVSDILSNQIVIQAGVTNDTHPPFFFLIVHFTRQIFGESDFAYRFPALLAGTLLVPLLAQVGRRMQGLALGVVVGGLTAVNPLQIWYANEARMYTLAILLVTAASYILWRVIVQTRKQTLAPGALARPLFGYLLVAGLAFYTHYTAAFLIAGQGMLWVLILGRQGHKRLLTGAAVILIIIAGPLIPYTVPRFFTGYEANFYQVAPWIMLQDVVRFFALGRTVDFESTPVILLNVGVAFLLLFGFWQAKGSWRRLFLIIWLLAIVLGLMAGSLFKPMYQGVRHIMLGSPAFLLLVGWGIVSLGAYLRQAQRPARLLWGIALVLGLVVTVTGPIVALDNYYSGRFGKDDFRSLIEYVEARAGANDVFLYNNAILLPLHNHYRRRLDVAVTASPIYPKAAATSPPQLADLAQTYDHIWFVTDPPADERDADGLVQQWLDENLLLVESTFFDSQTVEVRVRAYSTDSVVTAALPENGRILNMQWPDYPTLIGSRHTLSDSSLWLDFYWQGPPPADWHGLRLMLQGPDGFANGRIVETAVNLESSWQPGQINLRSYVMPLPSGTPPGNYTLLVQPLWLSEVPQTLAEPQPVATVTLAADTRDSADWPRSPARALFANGVRLREITLWAEAVRPGHNLPLTLFWEVDGESPRTDLRYELTVIAPDGVIFRQQSGHPGASWLTEWQPGQLLREPTGLYFPPDTLPGRYRLEMRLMEDGERIAGRPSWWPLNQESVDLGSVEVIPWPLETLVPEGATSIDVNFGPDILLNSYQLEVRPEGLALTLYWQSLAQPTTSWFVFVHLVNASGEIVVQRDLVPAEGLRPTQGWRPDEIVTDAHLLLLPPDLPAGQYTIRVGLFEPETSQRPFVSQNGVPQPDDHLILTGLNLP